MYSISFFFLFCARAFFWAQNSATSLLFPVPTFVTIFTTKLSVGHPIRVLLKP